MAVLPATMVRNQQRERRVSPALYKLLLTAHIMVSVGWLGIVVAKLVLGLVAITSSSTDIAAALYVSMGVVNRAFPPVAIATIVSGVLLALGTKWGLLQHYWVVTKLLLTVGVIVTAVQLSDRFVQQSIAPLSGQALAESPIVSLAEMPSTPLIALSGAHVFMLGLATVLSVYKPWGKTWFARRNTVQRSRGRQ